MLPYPQHAHRFQLEKRLGSPWIWASMLLTSGLTIKSPGDIPLLISSDTLTSKNFIFLHGSALPNRNTQLYIFTFYFARPLSFGSTNMQHTQYCLIWYSCTHPQGKLLGMIIPLPLVTCMMPKKIHKRKSMLCLYPTTPGLLL